MNALLYAQIILELLATFSATVQRYAAVINKARSEGRDISDEELADLQATRTQALERLKNQVS